MSLSQTISYDVAGNFSFDPALIEVSGARARLKLVSNPGQTFYQGFASASGFTYDAAKAEFAAGVVRQKDQAPSAAIIGSTFTTVSDASWTRGASGAATIVGTPTVAGGKLVCTGAALKGIYYQDAAIGAVSSAGAVKLRYTPNYTTPSTNLDLFGLEAVSGSTDRIAISHSPAGSTLRLSITNATGTAVYTASAIGGAWNPVAGTEYELELNWDNVAGVVRIFINGALHGTLSPGAWTRGTTAVRLRVGVCATLYNVADASFNDVLFFNAVQHTAAYTPGYSVSETLYDTSVVTLPAFTYPGVGALQAFTAFAATATGSPRFVVGGKYWNGSAWATSDDSYAQASSAATVNGNIGTLAAAGSLIVKVVFQEQNATQESVDDLTTTYTGQYSRRQTRRS